MWEPKTDVGVFAAAKIPSELNITPLLLADLHDMVLCFGTESVQEHVKRYVHRGEQVVTITVSTNEGNHGMVLTVGSVNEKPIILEGGLGGDGVPCPIIIDSKLNLEQIPHIIAAADVAASKNDGIKDGKRQNLEISAQPPKMEVNMIFQQQGACIPVLPQPGDTLQSVLDRAKATILMFDKPDELGIMNHPHSGINIIRKADVEFLQKKDRIANEVLVDYGVNIDRLGELPPEKLLEIKNEVDRRMQLPEESTNGNGRILQGPDKTQQD